MHPFPVQVSSDSAVGGGREKIVKKGVNCKNTHKEMEARNFRIRQVRSVSGSRHTATNKL